MFYIYGLRSSEDSTIMYVGKTNNPAMRLLSHASEAASAGSKKQQWIQSVIATGAELEMVIIDRISDDNSWRDLERFWVAYFTDINPALTNGPCGYGDLPERINPRKDFEMRDQPSITLSVAQVVSEYNTILTKQMRVGNKSIQIDDQIYEFGTSLYKYKMDGIGLHWLDLPLFIKSKVLRMARLFNGSDIFVEALDLLKRRSGLSAKDIFHLCIMVEYAQYIGHITDADRNNLELLLGEHYGSLYQV